MAEDWFTRLMGFPEGDYDDTRALLKVEGDHLVSTVTGARHGVGTLSLPTVGQSRVDTTFPHPRRSTVRCVTGEARSMHADPELDGACSRWRRSSTCWR